MLFVLFLKYKYIYKGLQSNDACACPFTLSIATQVLKMEFAALCMCTNIQIYLPVGRLRNMFWT